MKQVAIKTSFDYAQVLLATVSVALNVWFGWLLLSGLQRALGDVQSLAAFPQQTAHAVRSSFRFLAILYGVASIVWIFFFNRAIRHLIFTVRSFFASRIESDDRKA